MSNNPATDGPQMRPERYGAARAQLVELAGERHPKFTRHRALFTVGAGGLLIVTAVAFTGINHQSVSDRGEYHCRAGNEETSLDVSAQLASTDPTAKTSDYGVARDACADMWSEGILRLNATSVNALVGTPTTSSVPPLVVCVNANGQAVVVPGESSQICSSLGLAHP